MAVVEDFKLRFGTEGVEKISKAKKEVAEVKKEVSSFRKDLDGLGQVGGPLGNTINGITSKLGLMGSVAGVAGGAIVGLGLQALRLAGEINNIASASGIAAGQVQSFKNSVVAAGGSGSQFADILTDLNKNLQDAAGGNAGLQESFRTLGVFVTDANGKVRNTGDVLSDITALFRSGQLSSAQYAASLKILGEGIKNLDVTQLSALRDPVADADIKALDEYNKAINRVRTSLESKIVSFIGGILVDIENTKKGLDEYEARLNEVKKTQRGFLEFAFQTTLGFKMGPVSPFPQGVRRFRDQTPEEIARAEMARKDELMKPYKSRAGVGRQGEAGGFGITPTTNTDKAASEKAARELNVFRSLNEERKNILLRNAKNEEDAIKIRGDAESALARKTITDAEELGAKLREINSRTVLDIANVKKNAADRAAEEDKRAADAAAREAERAAELAKREIERINDLIARSKEVTEEQRALNEVLSQRNKFINDNVTATDRERERAQQLFDLEQDRLSTLRQISLIKDLPADQRAAREAEINAEFAKRRGLVEKQQAADKSASESFSKGFEKAYKQYSEDAKDNFGRARRIFEISTKGMEDAVVGFAKTGKFEFKGFLSSILEELLRSQVQQLIAQLFTGGKSSNSGSQIIGAIGSVGKLLGFASGGTIPTNGPVLVGERGPEVLSGVGGRVVTPNNQLGGGGNVTYNINAVDAKSFKQMVAADPTFLYSVTEQGRRRLPGAR